MQYICNKIILARLIYLAGSTIYCIWLSFDMGVMMLPLYCCCTVIPQTALQM